MNTTQQTKPRSSSESCNAMEGGFWSEIGHRVANAVALAAGVFVVLGMAFRLI